MSRTRCSATTSAFTRVFDALWAVRRRAGTHFDTLQSRNLGPGSAERRFPPPRARDT